MPAKPGTRPPNAGQGRRRGSKNRFTADVRQAVAAFAQNNVHRLEEWITAVAKRDPARAAEIFLRALEFYVPKLQRSEVVRAPDPAKPVRHWTTAQLEAELERLDDLERDAHAIDANGSADHTRPSGARRNTPVLAKLPVSAPKS